jgi:hypothetical protein
LAVDGAGGEFGCGVVDYVMGIAWVRGIVGGGVRRVNDFYHLRVV